MTRELLQQSLEALNGSVDLVRNEYESNWRHGIPTRKAQLDSYKHDLEVHEKVISDIKAELTKPEQQERKPSIVEPGDGYKLSQELWLAVQNCVFAQCGDVVRTDTAAMKEMRALIDSVCVRIDSPPAQQERKLAWHDAPTVPGLWASVASWGGTAAQVVSASEIRNHNFDSVDRRWYGPIPDDY